MVLSPNTRFDKVSEELVAEGEEQPAERDSPEKASATKLHDICSVDASFSELMGVCGVDGITQKQLNAIAPISLAYIGDAVFELYVRSRLLMPFKRIRDYHQQVVSQVKAEQQSCYVDVLLPHLNEAEKDILRRGRNATTGRNRRAKGQDYQKATGLESLIGFLYLSDPHRLMTLLNQLEI
ncbi:MAG: ribonuclease III domain-containing protein [Cyanobacteria bacterium P01_D01_bin.36]